MSTHNGHQLLPLEKRMNAHELDRRTHKRQDRSTFRAQISTEHAKTRGIAVTVLQVLQRDFWGRLRWLLRGK